MFFWNVDSKFLGMLRISFDESAFGITSSLKTTTGAVTNVEMFVNANPSKTEHPNFQEFVEKLRSYEAGEFAALNSIGVQISGTAFQQKVLLAMRQIDAGDVLSYKELAEKVDSPKAYRAVASVCARNSIPLIFPCHRVVPSDYSVGNYASHHIDNGTQVKTKLLQHENVMV